MYHFTLADQKETTEMYLGKVRCIIGTCTFNPNVLLIMSLILYIVDFFIITLNSYNVLKYIVISLFSQFSVMI